MILKHFGLRIKEILSENYFGNKPNILDKILNKIKISAATKHMQANFEKHFKETKMLIEARKQNDVYWIEDHFR
jgi:hypothetical protein